MVDPLTGEIISDDIDSVLSYISKAEKTISYLYASIIMAKEIIYKKVNFCEGNTARIKGDKYTCKIELPTKVRWDQKKLSKIYSIYPHGTIVDSVVKIASYKVDMREYKKIINTVGNEDFNKFKEELIASNLGIIGTPRFTIENE